MTRAPVGALTGRSEARAAGNGHAGEADLRREWGAKTRIFLQPVAAPSILGLFGFASSTFLVAGNAEGQGRPVAAAASHVEARLGPGLCAFLKRRRP